MGVILAPANGAGHAQQLVAAGASELYLGFHDDAWTERFGARNGLNRMSGFGEEANALGFAELLAEAESVRGRSARDDAPARLYCVFNSASYDAEQVAFIEDAYLAPLRDAGFAGIIVSGPELVTAAHAHGLAAVASTMCAVYNARIASYYRELGMDRVIIPRDVALDDIGEIRDAVPELRYEVFFMRNGCIFADSHCLGLHKAGRPSLCRSLREAYVSQQYSDAAFERDPYNLQLAIAQNNGIYRACFHENACGLCALWRLEQAGVDAYKIVGRGDNVEDLCNDVALSARNLDIARACRSEREYLEAMERPDDLLALCAQEGLSCYYPEPRFGH